MKTGLTFFYQKNLIALVLLPVLVIVLCSCKNNRKSVVLQNDLIALTVSFSDNNFPFIEKSRFKNSPYREIQSHTLDRKFNHFSKKITINQTVFYDSGSFKTLEIKGFNDSLEYTWIFKLLEKTCSFSSQLTIKNNGASLINFEQYPILSQLLLAENNLDQLKFWKSLSLKPVVKELSDDGNISVSSAMYSSEAPNELPYWEISGKQVSLFYGLFWSGGWKADFNKLANGVHLSVYLPENETQLTLLPNEEIAGPEIMTTISDKTSEMQRRQTWLTDRENWVKALFQKPEPSYPLIYNSWYAVELNLSKEFIINQLKAMKPFAFDAFVIDDGWYKSIGDWGPNLTKFPEKLDLKDTAVIRFYAQSCLPGTFGISADLYKLPESFQKIIGEEIVNYRKVNKWKRDMLYDIHYPENDNDMGYIVFFKNNSDSVAIICGRKNANEELDVSINLNPIINTKEISKITFKLNTNEYSKITFKQFERK